MWVCHSVAAAKSINALKKSENQRIKLQRRKVHNPFSPRKKHKRLSRRMVIEDCANSGTHLRQVQTRQDKVLQTDNQVFVWRKNKVVGELDFAVEVVATAFGIELASIQLPKVCIGFFVLMFMVETMQTIVGHCTKAARQLMVFGAVMELHVPTDRYEQHHKGHQKGTDLQQPLFHGCKSKDFLYFRSKI